MIDRNPTDITDTLGGRSARLTAPGGAVTEKFWSPIEGDYEYAIEHGLTRSHDQRHFAGLMLRAGGIVAVCMLPSGYYWTVALTRVADLPDYDWLRSRLDGCDAAPDSLEYCDAFCDVVEALGLDNEQPSGEPWTSEALRDEIAAHEDDE